MTKEMDRRSFLRGTAWMGVAAFAAGCVGLDGGDGDAVAWRPGHYQVHYIFTGRGESMFHVFPDGTSMLLDVGDSMRFYGTPKETPHLPDISRRAGEWVARYVERVNPKGRKVDYFHLSHYHEDHGGGERYHGERIAAPTLVASVTFSRTATRDAFSQRISGETKAGRFITARTQREGAKPVTFVRISSDAV